MVEVWPVRAAVQKWWRRAGDSGKLYAALPAAAPGNAVITAPQVRQDKLAAQAHVYAKGEVTTFDMRDAIAPPGSADMW